MEYYTPLISFNWNLVMNIITLLVLFLILKHFFFEKLRKFMLAREQKVKDAFDNADRVNRLADEKLTEYNENLARIDAKSREMLRETKQIADERAREIIEEANKNSKEMMAKAQKEIEREREKALDDMKEQVATLAVLAAEKIIEQTLDDAGQQSIIDGVIKEAGETQWKQ